MPVLGAGRGIYTLQVLLCQGLYLSLFRFMSFTPSCPVISLLFFFCVRIGPALSTHAHVYIQPRFKVAQVLIRRYGSPVVPMHLVSPSSQSHTHTLVLCCHVSFSCLRLFVSFCACAYTYIYIYTDTCYILYIRIKQDHGFVPFRWVSSAKP